MPDENVRLFLALPLPESLRSILWDWCSRDKEILPFQTWVHKDDYHITLHFLGDTPSSRIRDISDSLIPSLRSSSPFSLAVGSLGVFGRQQSPRILWAGVTGDLQGLGTLQRTVEGAMHRIGFAKEDKVYRPHITLARRYCGSTPFLEEWLKSPLISPNEEEGWQVDHAVLYQTHMKRKPMYEILESFSIGEDQK